MRSKAAGTFPAKDSSGGVLTISPGEFENIRKLAYEKFGLNLQPGKEGLVTARLARVLRSSGFSTIREYHQHLLADRTGQGLVQLIDALTTNHTFFLREPAHFEFLAKVAAGELRDAANLRLWCCACSTGEEPYGLAMCLLDAGQAARCRWTSHVSILATDISTRVLAKAKEASYAEQRLAAAPGHWKQRYFQARNGGWQVREEIRSLVRFSRLNLIESFEPGKFQALFCRNVMIYFDRPTQQNIVNRLARCLEPNGYLFIGHSETLTGYRHELQYVAPAVYRLPAKGGG